MKKESIKLTPAQRQRIEQILSKGKALAWTLKHAQVLLKVARLASDGATLVIWSSCKMH